MGETIRTTASRPLRQRLIDDMNVRRFQIEQRDAGVPAPTMNSIVSALRFFFTQTIDRPDLARKLIRTIHPRNFPIVLSRDEVTRLLNATTCLKLPAAATVPRSMTQLVPNVISCDSMVDFDHHSNTRNRHAAHHCHNSATCQPLSVSQTSSNASPETNSP